MKTIERWVEGVKNGRIRSPRMLHAERGNFKVRGGGSA